jgi:hypothetical protein
VLSSETVSTEQNTTTPIAPPDTEFPVIAIVSAVSVAGALTLGAVLTWRFRLLAFLASCRRRSSPAQAGRRRERARTVDLSSVRCYSKGQRILCSLDDAEAWSMVVVLGKTKQGERVVLDGIDDVRIASGTAQVYLMKAKKVYRVVSAAPCYKKLLNELVGHS